MSDDAGRTHSYELPKGYVDDKGVLHREITIREISGADQEAVLSPQVKNNPAKMMTTLLARVILKLGTLDKARIDTTVTAAMVKSDRDFIYLKLKELDSGPEMQVDVECPDCSRKFKAAVDVGDFLSN